MQTMNQLRDVISSHIGNDGASVNTLVEKMGTSG